MPVSQESYDRETVSNFLHYFAILHFYHKKYSNWIAILGNFESTLLEKPSDALQTGLFKHKTKKSKVG